MSLKVLLADDNITAQRLGSKILTEAGHEVIAVSNGAAAVKKIASDKPDLLILDVFMPGYSGLEVCEKVRNDPATAQLPVILTVTNMEPFNQQDGNRVRANGVMIKPFEATDLLAVVQKFEIKAAQAPAKEAEYQKTIKIAAVEEFKDASYEEWKTEAAEEPEPSKIELPQEIAAAPALGFDEMPTAEIPVTPEPPPPSAAAPPPMEWAPVGIPAAATLEPVQAPPPPEAPPEIARPAELEFTAAQQVGEIHVGQAAELEVSASSREVVLAQDPALVTDADEMAQFATKVGQEHPEEIAVGIAMPGLTGAPPEEAPAPETEVKPPPTATDEFATTVKMAAYPQPVPGAPETPPGAPPAEAEQSAVEVDMMHAFSTAPQEVAAASPGVAEPAPAAAESAHDELVAQFAAELDQAHREREEASANAPAVEEAPLTESSMAAASEVPASQLDEERIAAAVNRALEKYKDGLRAELIATIMRELRN